MCPKCQSENKVKNGVLKGKQRFKRNCGCELYPDLSRKCRKGEKRRSTLSMYLEGLGFHSIGGLLGVSHVSVINWARKYEQNLSEIKKI